MKQALQLRSASLVTLVLMAGLSLAVAGSSTRSFAAAPAPFGPPPPLRLDVSDPVPLADITGSISTDGKNTKPEAIPLPAAEPKAQAAETPPVVSVPMPDVPPPAVIDTASPATLAVGGTALADALKLFTATDLDRHWTGTPAQIRQRVKEREAIAAFYAAHDNAPLWIDGTQFSGKAKAVLAQIDRAGEDGLMLGDYAVPALSGTEPAKLAAAELAVSEAVVAYARQAGGSRIDPLQINRLITAKRSLAEPADILSAVPAAADAAATLRDYNPPQPGYAALRAKLAEVRQQEVPMAKETIPSGPTLRLGMRDPRVPLIRARFGLDLPSAVADADGLVYDTKVAAAVAEFQRTIGLPPSGLLTAKTIAALSGGNPSRLENELIANMERWRWMPRDLGTDHVAVNIADFSLEVVKSGTVVHRARVVVGKPDHQTPVFSDLMRFVIVNPYWNVPLSIIKREMLPKLAEDPNYFADHGYEVVEKNGETFVRQPPGDDNALGRIKFMFPNEHSVYLHDTNARALFGKERRAFSHGCVRVDQPFKLAEVVLGADRGWTEKRVKGMIGGDERTIRLPEPLPIHLTYFTAFVDADNSLQLRDDLYGYSGKVKLALGLKD